MNLYKKTIPYVLMGAASIFNFNSANAQSAQTIKLPELPKIVSFDKDVVAKIQVGHLEMPTDLRNTKIKLLAKAEDLRVTYMDNVLATQQKIAPHRGKRNYRAVVRQELPGAPVGLHCMYGQYTQLMRALTEKGDTLTIVPRQGGAACTQFKAQMRNKYRGAEYDGCILEGHAFPSDSAYNAALEKYMARQGINANTPADKRAAAEERFARTNFSAEQINPGSIWIVPRFRGSKTKFHAIMFLGRGKNVNGKFVPSADGQYMYAGFNSERIGNVFETYDMSNVFSADIERISAVDYGKELKRLESLPTEKLIEYISKGSNIRPEELRRQPRTVLVRMLHNAYFGEQQVCPAPVAQPVIAQAKMPQLMHVAQQHTI